MAEAAKKAPEAEKAPPKQAPAPKKKARKKKKPSGGPVRPLLDLAAGAQMAIVGMPKALFSKDSATRKVAVLFFLSLAGLGYVVNLAIDHYTEMKKKMAAEADAGPTQAENLASLFSRQKEAAFLKGATLELGKFVVELKSKPGAKLAPGVVNLAEMNLVIQCDSAPTCSYIQKYAGQARDQLTDVFTALEKDELMTLGGKKRLKEHIKSALNHWLPKGKITKLFITHLIIG